MHYLGVNDAMVRSIKSFEVDSPQDEDMDISMEDEYEEEVPFDPRFYEDFRTSRPDDCSECENGEPLTIKNARFPRSTLDLVENLLRILLWPVIEHDPGHSDSYASSYTSRYGSDEEMTAEGNIETKPEPKRREEAHALGDADSLGFDLSDVLDVNFQAKFYMLLLEGEEGSRIKGSARQIMGRFDLSTYLG